MDPLLYTLVACSLSVSICTLYVVLRLKGSAMSLDFSKLDAATADLTKTTAAIAQKLATAPDDQAHIDAAAGAVRQAELTLASAAGLAIMADGTIARPPETPAS